MIKLTLLVMLAGRYSMGYRCKRWNRLMKTRRRTKNGLNPDPYHDDV